MKKNHFSNTMRIMRFHYAKSNEEHDTYLKAIKKADELLRRDEITKTVYDREVDSAQTEFNYATRNLSPKRKANLSPNLKQ